MMEQWISVDTHYTRSINLERDNNSKDVLQAYIPTTRAFLMLEKMTHTFGKKTCPRSWSLVGSYGSGKSSFANFFGHLLAGDDDNRAVANEVLAKANTELFQKIQFVQTQKGHLIILLTGSPESLTQSLVHAMFQASETFFGKTHQITKKLLLATKNKQTPRDIVTFLKQLQSAVIQEKGSGILLIIDELGKFLEYEARHSSSNDIYLLQSIAEFAAQESDANLLFLVLMHQGFEQYAKGFGESLRNEWQKIQGRFESVSFLESAEQTLRIIAAAFHNQFNQNDAQLVTNQAEKIATVLDTQNALPKGLDIVTASELFAQCYPLHPLVLLILPVLCQKVAQNERTLFSYLGSIEAHGFKDSLQQLKSVGEWILPCEIFDYFIQNQPLATLDHATNRRWIEVISALERLGDCENHHQQLLKTVGLFNIIGSQSGFKASKELLDLCLPTVSQVENSLEFLTQKSLLQFRRYNSEYRIWEGSDFDLESALEEELQRAGHESLAEILNKRKTLLPVVARKYSIDKATLRYFQPIYADSTTNLLALENSSSPQLILGLTRNAEQLNALEGWIKAHYSQLNIYVLQNHNTEHLTKIISEVVALERIEQENQALNNDPVAQREFKNRLNYVKSEEAHLLHDFLDHPENYRWFHNGKLLNINNRRALQNALSQAFDATYPDTPIIKNELINRDKPSAQATGARNRLVSLLLTKSDCEDLGIEADKFPPEKAIYRAIFKETQIHQFHNGSWQFQAPLPNDQYKFYSAWQKITEVIQAKNRCLVSDIYAELTQPPFGVKAGVLPLLFVAYYLVNHRRLAIYESDVFCPTMQQEHFEILIKRPELFSVEAFAMRGIQEELFNQYLETFIGKIADKSTLLDIMKPLAKFIASLNAYTLHKKDFPPQTLAVLNAFHKTQRPTELLFTLLPQACGFEPFTQEQFESQPPKAFLDVLVEHFKVLQQAYPVLLADFKMAICDALELSPSLTTASVREAVTRFNGLEKYTKDETDLKAFILRLQSSATTDEAWLESIGALLGKVPPSKWKSDNHIMAFQQLKLLSKRLLELKDFNGQIEKEGNENAVMLRWISQSQGENSKVVFLDAQTQETANQLLMEMNQKLAGVDSNTKLVMIANLLAQL